MVIIITVAIVEHDDNLEILYHCVTLKKVR